MATRAEARPGELTVTSMGKRSPLNTREGKATDSTRRSGGGLPARENVSMGMPSCCACHAARAALPRFSLPSEISATRRTIPGGSVPMASRIAASRSVPWPASPAVYCKFHDFPRSWGAGLRAERANGITSVQCRPRDRSICVAMRRSAFQILRGQAARCVRQDRHCNFAVVERKARLGERGDDGQKCRRLEQQSRLGAQCSSTRARPTRRARERISGSRRDRKS